MGDTPSTDAPAMGTEVNNLKPPTTEPPAPPKDATSDDADMGDTGKKALDAERKARRDAEARLKELEPLAEEARKRTEGEKSELTKAQEALVTEREARTKAESELLRYAVGADKNVPLKLIRFLHGTTKEEVEASADALLAEVGNAKPALPTRPTERLSNGRPSSSLDDDDPITLIEKARGRDPFAKT
jgi:regulator of protease activity HflC (stomatin/prohibitin superfamily)